MPLCLYAFMPLFLSAFMPLCLYALSALVRCVIVDILNLNLSPNPFKFLQMQQFLENRLLFGEILWIKWTHFGNTSLSAVPFSLAYYSRFNEVLI